MRKLFVSGAIALAAFSAGAIAIAAESEPELKHQHWHFKGPFGTYDRASAQRDSSSPLVCVSRWYVVIFSLPSLPLFTFLPPSLA